MEWHQWLFRKNGFKVSDEAYLVYFNGLKDEQMFNQQLRFELHLIKIKCNDEWVENAVISACNLLSSDEYPQGSKSCMTCQYLKNRWNINQKI